MKAWYEHCVGVVDVSETVEPFSKAKAINEGVKRHPGKILVIADADCVICNRAFNVSVEMVRQDPTHLVLPHNSLCLTTLQQANYLLALDPTKSVSGRLFRGTRKNRKCPGGIWVVNQKLLADNPVDERFIGWGHEDNELLSRVPHKRIDGPIFHIWHERASRKNAAKNRRMAIDSIRENEKANPPK